jgi:hypothetical protein
MEHGTLQLPESLRHAEQPPHGRHVVGACHDVRRRIWVGVASSPRALSSSSSSFSSSSASSSSFRRLCPRSLSGYEGRQREGKAGSASLDHKARRSNNGWGTQPRRLLCPLAYQCHPIQPVVLLIIIAASLVLCPILTRCRVGGLP